MMKNQTRLITSASYLVRQLTTGTAEALTETRAPMAAKSPENEVKLYRRLSATGATKRSVTETLNEYVMEGKFIVKSELGRCVKQLRKYRRFDDALEVMEWMLKRNMNFSYTDHAVCLDLTAKTKGITAAENYFNGLPPSAKNRLTYGALLNCYCVDQMKDKALALFKKMGELDFLSVSLPFNNLMSMYMKLGKPEKVPPLVEQMKQKNISLCGFSYVLWMQSYASLNKIDEVERVLEEMEKDSEEKFSWVTYSNLASIYVKAELYEKAELALKKLEEMKPRDREAYHFLISLYGNTSNLAEVIRVWNSLKLSFPMTNMSYLVTLQALAKLNAIQDMKICFEEWESTYKFYDMRLADVVIRAYLKQLMYDQAVLVFDDAIKRTKGQYFKARESFMIYYLRTHQLGLALKEMKLAISEAKNRQWLPSEETVGCFFRLFEKEKDVDGAEEFFKLLKSLNCLYSNAYKSLIRTYVAAEKMAPGMRQRLEDDEIEISQELGELLARVCPE